MQTSCDLLSARGRAAACKLEGNWLIHFLPAALSRWEEHQLDP